MKSLDALLQHNKQIRVAGFDDAPFNRARGTPVKVSGIICSNTRFEGMLWGEAEKDGHNATEVIASLLENSKFLSQIHVVITDGIAIGGFNLIDLPALSQRLERPCIAVMRKAPNLTAIDQALQNFPDYTERRVTLQKAGTIHQAGNFYYQVAGCDPHTAGQVLTRLTDTGHVPEALRLAHLIGSAIMTGQSSNRA